MDNEKEGFPITAIREIKILKELRHQNIVQLKEIVTSDPSPDGQAGIFMVFEYMDHDLTGLMMSEGWNPTSGQIKWIMKQLLLGLHHCHANHILHRDIKGSNLLINNKGQLKLADFGLARPFNEQVNNYTNRVITLWYRPPELLLGSVQYGPSVDVWGAGCILAELLTKKPLFPGRTELDELDLIFKLCGSPNKDNWPTVEKLPWYDMFKPQKTYTRKLADEFKQHYSFPNQAIELLDKMLTLDPAKRISAEGAVDHEFFWTDPRPEQNWNLGAVPSSHEFQAKKRKGVPVTTSPSKQQRKAPNRHQDQPQPSSRPARRPNEN